jgi:hypothetical protein
MNIKKTALQLLAHQNHKNNRHQTEDLRLSLRFSLSFRLSFAFVLVILLSFHSLVAFVSLLGRFWREVDA